MKDLRRAILNFTVVIAAGLIAAIICQFFAKAPTDRHIHITSFRYGKNPSVIRCNRGDKLHLTFSTDDTGHSFFLEEFDMDAKVSPARDEVSVFKTSDPTIAPVLTREYTFTAKHAGIMNYLVARSNYRCHVWCGPMHAFEQGKLVILPNTLLLFCLGSAAAIFVLWIIGMFRYPYEKHATSSDYSDQDDLLSRSGLLRNLITSRWPQAIFTILAMLMIYVVILTSMFGTLMSGRNLGVLLMWGVWLFLLVAILTPFLGRVWCTICPLPLFGDLIQRRSFFTPEKGRTNEYNNKFSGLFLKWPEFLRNDWLRLIVFLALATFSTTLVANPRVSGLAVIGLLTVPTLMSMIWELRAFCRYVCPVSVFVGPFSRMSPIALRSKSMKVCSECKPHYCQKGSPKGWACPYGINVGEMKENSDCGLCLECTRSCLYNNVALIKRPAASELGTRSLSEAWLTMAIFTLAIVYSILYEGHWPVVRDFVNILDKENWGLFGIYSIILNLVAVVIVPGLIYFLSLAGRTASKTKKVMREVFLRSAGVLLPLGMALWIAFVIPMLFVNVTFIAQSLSDPFGWGWDFFGTSNIPWHQFLPELTPWLQGLIILAGTYLSLRNLKLTWAEKDMGLQQRFLLSLPMSIFLLAASVGMIFFFTN
jgi:heme/copper-type cytochrome/quinol oxidase subunit 2